MADILMVEANRNLRLLYKSELEAEGHRVAAVRDCAGAVRAIRRTKPDVVVLETAADGRYEEVRLLARVLRQSKSMPVVVNTGYSPRPDRFTAFAVAAYVLKSADLAPLKSAIEDVLAGSGDRLPGQRAAGLGRPLTSGSLGLA